MELERILNAGGPSQGEIIRSSDGKVPHKIAWLQCIGSRTKKCGHSYCSSVCCEYAIKQLILVKEHIPDARTAIFYTDIRAYGKGFEDLYARARNLDGSRFIKKRISSLKEDRNTHDLILKYVSDDHTVIEETFNLVVLSVGLIPLSENQSLSQILGYL